jgi:alpha-galactosidase
LLIGCDMADMDAFTLGLLSNTEVLDVNQDPLGIHASKVESGDGRAVYVKPLEDGSLAVGLFNLGESTARITLPLRLMGVHSGVVIRDLWRQKDLGTVSAGGSWETEVSPHGVVLLKLTNN